MRSCRFSTLLAHKTETDGDRTCEKQNEFRFIASSGRAVFANRREMGGPFLLPTSPFERSLSGRRFRVLGVGSVPVSG